LTGFELLLLKIIVGGVSAGTARAVTSHALRRASSGRYLTSSTYYPRRYYR